MEFFTSSNQFLLDWGIGLVVFGEDCENKKNCSPTMYVYGMHIKTVKIYMDLTYLMHQSR